MPTSLRDRPKDDVPALIRKQLARSAHAYYAAAADIDGECLESALFTHGTETDTPVVGIVFIAPLNTVGMQLMGAINQVVNAYLDHWEEWEAMKAKHGRST